MEKDKNNSSGCFKGFLYICGAIAVLMLISGAMQGIGKVMLNIPWYVNFILGVGIVFILSRVFER